MKIFSSSQLREADAYTIKNEPISSVDLMERAGNQCFNWIRLSHGFAGSYSVICGNGNNGGDGLVIARLLAEKLIPVEVIVTGISNNPTYDFSTNLERLKQFPVEVRNMNEGDQLKINHEVIIDAIFGTGLNRPADGWIGDIIERMNESGREIISIDMPSGLFADKHTTGKFVIANHTLTFQSPKLAFFFPENKNCAGEFHVLDIGLDKKFLKSIKSDKNYLSRDKIKSLFKSRSKFSHKGDYGHALLVSGSKGKTGAAVMGARACLRSGVGLLTVHVPSSGYEILQSVVPEAMTEADENVDVITRLTDPGKYSAIGIGPGIGTADATKKMFFDLLGTDKSPMVIDADALNILSTNQEKIKNIPAGSILTPHPREFERLTGKSENDFDRHEKQIRFSVENKVYVVLKGAYTCISDPDGSVWFNSTGNPGMAKGGTGDALTGVLLALLSQKYSPKEAALIGVYVHGLAGDYAAKRKGEYSMICSDLIEMLPRAFRKLT